MFLVGWFQFNSQWLNDVLCALSVLLNLLKFVLWSRIWIMGLNAPNWVFLKWKSVKSTWLLLFGSSLALLVLFLLLVLVSGRNIYIFSEWWAASSSFQFCQFLLCIFESICYVHIYSGLRSLGNWLWSWRTDPFIIMYFACLLLTVFFVLKCILSDSDTLASAFICLVFAQHIIVLFNEFYQYA